MARDKNERWRRVEESLREQGAEVRLIRATEIVVDPRVRLKCQVPLCDSYNRCLTCPPRAPALNEFQEALRQFSRALLIQYHQPLYTRGKDGWDWALKGARRLHQLVNQGEKMAFMAGYRFATGFIGGACHLCDECAGYRPGEPCRHPFEARPSMEAVGIDVVSTASKAGMPLIFPVVDEVRWTGLILLD